MARNDRDRGAPEWVSRSLNHVIGVRIPASQPISSPIPAIACVGRPVPAPEAQAGVSANRLQTVQRKAQESPTKAGSSGPLKAEPRAPP